MVQAAIGAMDVAALHQSGDVIVHQRRGLGHRIEIYQRGPDRLETVLRNHISREAVADVSSPCGVGPGCERIIDTVRYDSCEVARPHRGGRYRQHLGRPRHLTEPLIIGKEERAIFAAVVRQDHGSADAAAILVELVRWFRKTAVREETECIKFIVAEKLEHRSMHLVAAGLRRQHRDGSGRSSVLRTRVIG